MELLGLFVTASMPVLKVLLLTGLGSYLALDSVNILGKDAIKYLNTIVFYVFNPALVGSSLANTVTYDSMIKLWFMPVNVLITFIIALCKEKGSPFGDSDVCYSYGMAYVSLSMAIGAIYLWSYVYNIVRVSSTSINDIKSSRESLEEPLLLPSPEDVALQVGDSESSGIKQLRLVKLFRELNLKALLAPSTIGAIIGYIIGVVPLFRKSLIGSGLRGEGIQKSLVVGIVVARYIALPLTGILVVKGAVHLGLVQQEPLYQFVLLLQFVVPPAMNIGTMTQLFGAGEKECSVIMFWTYALASISLTIWCTYFMWLVTTS
ncbi:hypothetical protein G4B88_002981 [Cannabis sativa]|uniref:Auxin efflux carrier n=1 Tax=Cannabis sativa TaxID=3483 RepID=A0A7J6FK25_CANSA|nr:hypothetical protein G4B88_002981 [Cannabis sativa]